MNSISLPLQYSVVCVAGLKNHCSSITIKFLITNRKRCRIKKKLKLFVLILLPKWACENKSMKIWRKLTSPKSFLENRLNENSKKLIKNELKRFIFDSLPTEWCYTVSDIGNVTLHTLKSTKLNMVKNFERPQSPS